MYIYIYIYIYNLNLRFDMVEITGKRNRKVPVLLTPAVKEAIVVLEANREKGNVNSDNIYIFATNDGKSLNPIRGNDVIRQVCGMVDLQQPDVITNTLQPFPSWWRWMTMNLGGWRDILAMILMSTENFTDYKKVRWRWLWWGICCWP